MTTVSVEQVIRFLRLQGYHVTPARRAVVAAAGAFGRPFTAGELCAAVAKRAAGVGRATVFRTLELLEREHLVERVHAHGPHGHGSAYVLVSRLPSQSRPRRQAHHYFVCAACNRITEVEDAELGAAVERLARRHGFAVEEERLEMFGRCGTC